MTDTNISLTEKVDALNRPAKMYFDEILKSSEDNIFVAIKNLRKAQADGEVEPEFQAAANFALVAMTAHLAGDEGPRQKTDSEALADLQGRIEQARLAGDKELYDSLRAGLAHVAEKAIAADELHQKRTADLDAQNQAYETENKARYESMLKDWRDAEILNLRRGGMDLVEAENHFEKFSAKSMEDIARKTTGYTHREPISLEE